MATLLYIVLVCKVVYGNISGPQKRQADNPQQALAARGCLNASGISKTVYASQIIFSGKILSLSLIPAENEVEDVVQENTPYYYYYNFTRKRRRISPSLVFSPKSKVLPAKHLNWVALVNIKTIFKGLEGDKGLEGRNYSLTIVETPTKCLRRLRALDTRIFFYRRRMMKPSEAELRLRDEDEELVLAGWEQTLMPLPPTLLVITAVRDAVKGKTRPNFRPYLHFLQGNLINRSV